MRTRIAPDSGKRWIQVRSVPPANHYCIRPGWCRLWSRRTRRCAAARRSRPGRRGRVRWTGA